jgi:surface protein
MFRGANAFNQDIGNWNVSNVTNFSNFMAGKTSTNYSAQNLDSIYNGWSQLTLQPNLTIDFNTIDYCDTSEANKQSIVTNFGWNITDGNAVPC